MNMVLFYEFGASELSPQRTYKSPTATMPDTYHDIESRITDAILELDKRENPNVTAVARQFKVPPSRLRNRWKGRKSKIDSGGHNKVLSEAQESALCQYLDNLHGGGPKARYRHLE